MEEIELLDIADDLLVINKTTIERLFQEDNHNPLVLYLFYYRTAKWQKANPIKASDDYCKRCLRWGIDKVQATKKRLREMSLIETIRKTNEKGTVVGWYVKVNYLIDESRIPETTIPDYQKVEKTPNKILSNNNINANNNINTKKENIKRKEYFENEEINNLFYEFLEVRKKKKAVNSDRALKALINKLNKYNDDIKYKMIEKSIINSWKDVYELKESDVPNWFDKDLSKEEKPKEDNLTDEQRERIERLIAMDGK